MVNIMAIEKNTTGSNAAGTVTHKMIIETSEGNFAVSLFSNNDLHQDFAKAFGDGSNIVELMGTLTTSVKIVPNEAATKDDSRTNRLLAMKATT
jgi:hypothetical protein